MNSSDSEDSDEFFDVEPCRSTTLITPTRAKINQPINISGDDKLQSTSKDTSSLKRRVVSQIPDSDDESASESHDNFSSSSGESTPCRKKIRTARSVFNRNAVQTFESESDSDDSATNDKIHNAKNHVGFDEVMSTEHLSSDEIPNSPGQPSCSQSRFMRRKIIRRAAQCSSETAKNKGNHNAKRHAAFDEVMLTGNDNIQLIRTVRGKLKLCHNGFSYHHNRTVSNSIYPL